MRALLPHPADDVDVHRCYAEEWLAEGGLRADFVASIDGAATADGLSRGLQTPGDNRVFAALRDLADVILVGAGTARIEGYAKVRPAGERLAVRRRFGLADELPTAVVSDDLDLDPGSALFTGAGPRTIVVTTDRAPADRRAALARVADVVSTGAGSVDFAVARRELAARGLRRIDCEGGPTLLASILAQDQCDELCLSITPFLVGSSGKRITDGPALPTGQRTARLISLLSEDDALFARYRITTNGRETRASTPPTT